MKTAVCKDRRPCFARERGSKRCRILMESYDGTGKMCPFRKSKMTDIVIPEILFLEKKVPWIKKPGTKKIYRARRKERLRAMK